jgi:transposase
VQSEQQHAITLLGPVNRDSAWQAQPDQGFSLADFALDWEAQQARCPQGKVSQHWSEGRDGEGNACIRIAFDPKDCRLCECRCQCRKAKAGAPSRTIRPQQQHQALQAARLRQQTAEFKQQYAKRAGNEGTLSQGVRRCSFSRAR